VGVRQCEADGCNAVEFKTTGWCHIHKDLHEPLQPEDLWWRNPVEEVQEDEFDSTAESIEAEQISHDGYNQNEKGLTFTGESNDTEPNVLSWGVGIGIILLLFVVAGMISMLVSPEYEKDSMRLDLQQQSYEPESTAELWNHSFNEPEGCFPYVYSWTWNYDGDFSFEWDIDLSCAIQSDLTVALSLVDSESRVEYSGSLTYSTYYNDWENNSLTLNSVPAGSYWLYGNAQAENQYVHEVLRVYVVLS